MSIFSPMTIATPASSSRHHRTLAACGLALALSLLVTRTIAADLPGTVLRNGIRLEDQIEVVNTRSICGGGNSELMRNGLKFETYAVRDDAGDRHWQPSDLDSFLAFDPSVPTIIF